MSVIRNVVHRLAGAPLLITRRTRWAFVDDRGPHDPDAGGDLAALRSLLTRRAGTAPALPAIEDGAPAQRSQTSPPTVLTA